MSLNITIRDESAADATAITTVTVAAFESLEISHHTEQFIVEALRRAGALTVSLVAMVDGDIVGHIAFSPVTVSDGSPNWFGVGPLSVTPAYQRQGIGKALMEAGLARLKALNAGGCCLVGHPAYYRQFGFENRPELVLEGVPPDVFFCLSFNGQYPHGSVAFHPGFSATASPA